MPIVLIAGGVALLGGVGFAGFAISDLIKTMMWLSLVLAALYALYLGAKAMDWV